MRNLLTFWVITILACLLIGCNGPKTSSEIAIDSFFAEEIVTVNDIPIAAPTPATAAVLAIQVEDAREAALLAVIIPPAANAVLFATLTEADDGDGNAETFSLDLSVTGVESFPAGFTSFQAFDVLTSACTRVVGADDGTLIGPVAYPFIAEFKLGAPNGKSYNARFGGYGASQYAIHNSGTLYRLHFIGKCPGGEVVLERFSFSFYTERLPLEPSVIKFSF